MPRKFQELLLRVYSKSLSKGDLILAATEEYIEGEWKGYEVSGISHHTPTKAGGIMRRRKESGGSGGSGAKKGRRAWSEEEVYNGQLSQETYCADDETLTEDHRSSLGRSSFGTGDEIVSDFESSQGSVGVKKGLDLSLAYEGAGARKRSLDGLGKGDTGCETPLKGKPSKKKGKISGEAGDAVLEK